MMHQRCTCQIRVAEDEHRGKCTMVGPMPHDQAPENSQANPKLAVVSAESNIDVRRISAIPSDDTAPIVVANSAEQKLRFSWPCWSPDGGALLISGNGNDDDGDVRMEVWRVMGEGSEKPSLVFSNDSDAPSMIAPGVPHYVNWSPSGRIAALVAQTRKGMMLHLVDARRAAPAQALMAGGPLYFAWAPDSQALAIHNGMEILLFDTASVGRGTVSAAREGLDASGSHRLAHDSPTFRTPVRNLDGSGFLYSTPNSSGDVTLWRSPRKGEGRVAITTLEANANLLRAPRSELVAVLPATADGMTAGQGLSIVGPEGLLEQFATGPITAAIWAPAAAALYYISPLGAEANLNLLRLDLESCRTQPLAEFRPSIEFATLLAFFDQYAQSHSLISPDGRWLTFAGLAANNGGGGRLGMAPQNGCYVVPTDGSQAPRRVSEGEISFFPPASSTEGVSNQPDRFREPPAVT